MLLVSPGGGGKMHDPTSSARTRPGKSSRAVNVGKARAGSSPASCCLGVHDAPVRTPFQSDRQSRRDCELIEGWRRGWDSDPTGALTAAVVLGFGIGANAAVFTIVNTVLLRPLPFERADDIVQVRRRTPFGSSGSFASSPCSALLQCVAVYSPRATTCRGGRSRP